MACRSRWCMQELLRTGEDAASRPYVNAEPVRGDTKEELRGAVPACKHLQRKSGGNEGQQHAQ